MARWLPGLAGGPPEEEQKALVEQLRGRFSGAQVDDVVLRRFLLTRSWKLDAAAVMLQANLAWRAEWLPVRREEVQRILDERTVVLLGAGATGQPVFMLNFLKLVKVDWGQEGELQRHIRAAVYCAEEMLASMPEGIETWVAVINCSGIRGPPQAFMQEFAKVMQANYPERAQKIVMYPVPRIIVKLVQTMMFFLPEKTREKVSFVSSLEGLCEETGLTHDLLPAEVLGTPADLEVLQGATAVEVPAGRTAVHRHALAAGDSIKWEFRVLEHNVTFELRFAAAGSAAASPASSPAARGGGGSGGGGAATEAPSAAPGSPSGAGAGYTIMRLERVNESSGEYAAEREGVLEFCFDNSFSYMRGKSVVVSCVPAA